MGDQLSPTYTKLHPGHVRLLRIRKLRRNGYLQCDLYSVRVHETGEYDALSYTWNGEVPSVPISCNGTLLQITPTLYDALCMLCEKSWSRPIWVDAICINQADEEEKAIQVPLMEDIYSKANEVVIWLGPAGTHTDLAADSLASLVETLGEYDRVILDASGDARIPATEHPFWSGLREIFERPWFTRLWVLQELVLAKSLLVCCGTKHIDWHEMVLLPSLLRRSGLLQRLSSTNSRAIDGIASLSQPKFLREGRAKGTQQFSLSYLIRSSGIREVTEPVDRIYAILGLADPGIRAKIRVDYSPNARRDYWKLYLAVGHLVIHEYGDMGVLLQVTTYGRPSELPSWCPNFNSRSITTLPIRSYSIDGMTPVHRKAPYVSASADGLRAKLQLCTIGQIKEVSSIAYTLSPGLHRGLHGNCSRILDWIADCLNFTGRERSAFATAESTLLRAFIADAFIGVEDGVSRPAPNDEELHRAFLGMVSYLQSYRDGTVQMWSDTGQTDEEGRLVNDFMNSFHFVCSGRRLYVSSGGYFGMGSNSVQRGDLVCYYRGCDMLLVLRPRPKDESFEFIGETYLQGVMNGELFDDTGRLLDGEMEGRLFTLS